MKELIISREHQPEDELYDVVPGGAIFLTQKILNDCHVKFNDDTLIIQSFSKNVIFDYQRRGNPFFFHFSRICNCVFQDNLGGQQNLKYNEFTKCLFSNIGGGEGIGNFVESCEFYDCVFSCVVFDCYSFMRNKFEGCVFIDCTFPEKSFLNMIEGNCKFIRCTFPKDCFKACAIDREGVEFYDCTFNDSESTTIIKDTLRDGMPDLNLAKLRDPKEYLVH